MKLQTTKLTPYLIATVVVLLTCFLQRAPHWFPGAELAQRLEWLTYDWRVRQAANFSPIVATNLGFVFINDTTIARVADENNDLGYAYGLYWPRHLYGRMLRELTTQGAKVVAFDVMFPELRPDHAPVTEPGRERIGSDEFFAREIKENGHVILATARQAMPRALFHTNAWMIGHIDADSDEGVLRRAKPFSDYLDWNERLREFARANGVDPEKTIIQPRQIIFILSNGKPFRIKVDARNRFNVYDLFDKPDPKLPDLYEPAYIKRRVWQTGIVMAARELKLDLKHPEIDWERGMITLRGTGGVVRHIPLDEDGYFYIDWCMTKNHPALTKEALDILLLSDHARQTKNEKAINEIQPRWKDKLVVIGSDATGNDLSDRGGTPLERSTVLVTKHWNVANSMITGRFVHHAGYGLSLAITAGLGLFSMLLTSKLRAPLGSMFVLLLAGAYVGVATYYYVEYRLWLPVILPVLGAVLLTHVSLVAYQVIFEEREKRRVKSVFSKLVSPNVVNELLGSEKLNFGGARRDITVLFADVRGFTKLTDLNQENAEKYVREHNLTGVAAEEYHNQQAQETLSTVNIYLSTIADQIKKHDGTLDKYIGDCVMAFWGAPTPNEKHAVACVKAAFDAQRAMNDLNNQRKEQNKQREAENPARIAAGQAPLPMLQTLALGTGINSGVSIVGLMGSEGHILNYTVFGREVNVASRLEGVSGISRIIIGGSTYDQVLKHDPELAATCVSLPPVQVKGIKDAVRIYEVPWKPVEPAAAEPPPPGTSPPPTSADAPAKS